MIFLLKPIFDETEKLKVMRGDNQLLCFCEVISDKRKTVVYEARIKAGNRIVNYNYSFLDLKSLFLCSLQ